MGLISLLLSPLDWWRVRHPAVWALNWLAPGLAAAGMMAAVYFSPFKLNLFGEFGLVHQANGLMPILAGFFIASLAAIATFNRPGLDETMKGDPPRLKRSGALEPEKLTRRRFLCLLFGYLSFAAIALYTAGAGAMIVAPAAAAVLHDEAIRTGARVIFTGAFGFFLSHAFLATILGIHYMAVRIQEPEPSSGYSRLAEKPPAEGQGQAS